MTAEAQTTVWGIAVFAPLLLNFATQRRVDAVGLSALLALIWALSRIFWLLHPAPEAMQWYAPIDLIGGLTCFACWRLDRRMWKLALTATFAGQLALHSAFWAAWLHLGGWDAGDAAETLLRRYIAFNNALFVLQLICASSPGVRRVAIVAIDRLSRRSRPHRHARA